MGVENNECVIATTWDDKSVDKVILWRSTLPVDEQALIVVLPSLANGKTTIVMAPDGSKKGWDIALRGHVLRNALIDILKAEDNEDGSSPWDWVEVGYGEFGQKVLQGNCQNCYSDEEYAG